MMFAPAMFLMLFGNHLPKNSAKPPMQIAEEDEPTNPPKEPNETQSN